MQAAQHLPHPGILLRTGFHLSPEGGPQAEGAHTLFGQGLLDAGNGEFQPSQRHVRPVELEIHQVAVRRREPADHNGAVELPVAVGEEQAAVTGQLPVCDAAFEVLHVRAYLLLAPFPFVHQTGHRAVGCRIAAGPVFTGLALPALFVMTDLIA